MMRRFLIAATLVLLVCGWNIPPEFAGQSSNLDAQHDYNAGRYNRAVDALNAGIAKSPDDASLHFLLGECYYQLHDFSRAMASFERAEQLSPKNSEIHDWLGKSYGRKAEGAVFLNAMSWARKAHHEFEVAVELDPMNFEAQRDLIRYEMNAPSVVSGGDDKAMRHIDALEKVDPIQGELARGEFFETKKRFPEADAVFAKIMESNNARAGVYFEASDYYRDRQDVTKMEEAIDKAMGVDPDDRRLKFYKGVLLIMQGKNPAEAEMDLKSYLSTVPDNSDVPPHALAQEWLGKLYESQKRYSESAEEYKKSLILDPHNKIVEEEYKRVQRK
ncbi:MAG TPA: tetratricopeptide repeat protein [Candidatus Saccharimonadales bacterium]|jgi:tetratricopeptide (TPR) repeat protein|nr:tetratricopeptide repeat protein [Candidatus Saccharimonadales bacterium]